MTSLLDRYLGCLLGGAVGDALGAPIEFLSLDQIRVRFGPRGLMDYSPAYGKIGAITDDTQMTLFTVEGLLCGYERGRERGIVDYPTMVYHAYLRWLDTQGDIVNYPITEPPVSRLLGIPELRAQRSPGKSCLFALRSGLVGTVEHPVNDSKGCGGVMRIAPVGLTSREPFDLACRIAALTHGHPSGYLSAGFMAQLIAELACGASLEEAIATARSILEDKPKSEECLAAVDYALELAASGVAIAERVEALGEGWVAEEAVGIGLYCALRAQSYEHGVLLAVNHGGDSDSTGAITGSILGTLWGPEAIPSKWRERLELRQLIEQLALDLYVAFGPQLAPASA